METNTAATSPEGNPQDATKKSNDVCVNCADLSNFTIDTNYLSVSPGQPHDLPYVTVSEPNWKVSFYCGRHKTSQVAGDFDSWCILGANPPVASAREVNSGFPHTKGTPGALNFAFGTSCTFTINGTPYSTNLYFGQGSSLGQSDWWVGGPWIWVDSSTNSATLTIYDDNGNVIKTYIVDPLNVNTFRFT